MNDANRNISIRPFPASRHLKVDFVGGIRVIALNSGRPFVRSARSGQIVDGPSVVIHSLSEPIDIRHDLESIARIIDNGYPRRSMGSARFD